MSSQTTSAPAPRPPALQVRRADGASAIDLPQWARAYLRAILEVEGLWPHDLDIALSQDAA